MNVATQEGLARTIERMGDQHRLVLRCGSVIVVDKANTRAILVLSKATAAEAGVRKAFEQMDWSWVDAAAGEVV